MKSAYPGELLTATVTSVKKGMAEGRKILSLASAPSPAGPETADVDDEYLLTRRSSGRHAMSGGKPLYFHDDAVDAPCRHFLDGCGGCSFQSLSYEAQLREKSRQLIDTFTRIGGFSRDPESGGLYFLRDHSAEPESVAVGPIVGCEEGSRYRYRNKMEFSFSNREWIPVGEIAPSSSSADAGDEDSTQVRAGEEQDAFALGLHAPGSFAKVLRIDACLLQHEVADGILKLMRSELERRGLSCYDSVEHRGYLRHLMIRKGTDAATGSATFLINVVTSDDSGIHELRELARCITQSFPSVVTVINQIAGGVSNAPKVEAEHVLHGDGLIFEQVCGVNFGISATSFFQTNPRQAEVLYEMIRDACDLRDGQRDSVLDLFCGTGSIGLTMAKHAKHVVGFEVVPSAVRDARINMELNGITNAEFHCGDLNKVWSELGDGPGGAPDVVVTDPARPGMHAKLCEWLNDCGARRIVYVSCNPSTQARDVSILTGTPRSPSGGKMRARYRLTRLQAVDMFPHTPHIESIAVLDRIDDAPSSPSSSSVPLS